MSDGSPQEINPYHFLLGAAVGAGGVIFGMQLASAIRKSKSNSSIAERTFGDQSRHASLYRSTGPESLENGFLTENNIINGEHSQIFSPTVSNGHLSSLITDHITDLDPIEEESTTDKSDTLKEADTLLQLLYNVGEKQSQQDNVIHRGISCNGCSANPLTGIRFKCANCVDYDICARCEPLSEHDVLHVLLKITIPIPPLANPRTTMLPIFYPGKPVVPKALPWQEALRLRDTSHFDANLIEMLYKQYKSLCTDKKGITKETFHLCLGPLASKRNLVVEQLYRFYDADGDGYINFEDFVHGMSVLAKGTKTERMKFIFKGYDLDNDGFISKNDLLQMLKAYHQLSMELVRDVVRSCEEEMMATYDDSGNRPISAVFNAPIPELENAGFWSKKQRGSTGSFTEDTSKDLFSQSTTYDNSNKKERKGAHERLSAVEAMTQDAIMELVDQIMQNADLDKDGKLSENDFFQYAVIDTSLLAWFEAIDTVF